MEQPRLSMMFLEVEREVLAWTTRRQRPQPRVDATRKGNLWKEVCIRYAIHIDTTGNKKRSKVEREYRKSKGEESRQKLVSFLGPSVSPSRPPELRAASLATFLLLFRSLVWRSIPFSQIAHRTADSRSRNATSLCYNVCTHASYLALLVFRTFSFGYGLLKKIDLNPRQDNKSHTPCSPLAILFLHFMSLSLFLSFALSYTRFRCARRSRVQPRRGKWNGECWWPEKDRWRRFRWDWRATSTRSYCYSVRENETPNTHIYIKVSGLYIFLYVHIHPHGDACMCVQDSGIVGEMGMSRDEERGLVCRG